MPPSYVPPSYEMLKRHPGDTYRWQTAIADIARNSPEMLASALDDLPFALRFEAEKALVGERLKLSFESEIRSLYDRPDGWKLFFPPFLAGKTSAINCWRNSRTFRRIGGRVWQMAP